MGQRDIAGLPRFYTKRDPDQIGNHLVQARGFGVDSHIAALTDTVDPDLQRSGIADRFVSVRVKTHLFRRGDIRRSRRGRLNNRRLNPELFGNPLGGRAEFHIGQEPHQDIRIRITDFQIIQHKVQRHVAIQLDQLLGQLDLCAMVNQRLPALGLFDLFCAVQQAFQITIFIDQQCRCLDPDAGRTRHVIDAIAGQRLNIHHTRRTNAEFLDHTIAIDTLVLHRIKHFDAIADQLHQVLVRRHDCDTPPRIARLMGEGRDDIIGLKPLHLFTSDIERFCGDPGQGNLRAQILWHGVTVRLVLVVHIVAERMAALIKDHRHMGRGIGTIVPVNIALQHVHKTADRPNGQAVRFACQRRKRMIGAKDERRSINQMQVTPFAEFRFHLTSSPHCLADFCHDLSCGASDHLSYAAGDRGNGEPFRLCPQSPYAPAWRRNKGIRSTPALWVSATRHADDPARLRRRHRPHAILEQCGSLVQV